MKVNLCILGAPGAGKAIVHDLLHDNVVTIDPYRARKEGARAEEDVYVSPVMLGELLNLNRTFDDDNPVLRVDSEKGDVEPYLIGGREYRRWLEVYHRASFFLVRETRQVLLHKEIDSDFRKIEIFAPVLSDMLDHPKAYSAIPFLEEFDKTIFLLLNPLGKSIRDFSPTQIIDRAGWIKERWREIQDRRDELKNKQVDPEEVKLRINLLPVEAEAWKNFALKSEKEPDKFKFVECLNWNHFEYKFLERKANPVKETMATVNDILDAAIAVDEETRDILMDFMIK